MVCEHVHAAWITYFGVAIYILVQQYIFQSGNTYFRAAIHISEHKYIFKNHGENDKLEQYEDGEFGTRSGRTRY